MVRPGSMGVAWATLPIGDVDGGPMGDETFDIGQGTGGGGLEERLLGGSQRSGDSGADRGDGKTDDARGCLHDGSTRSFRFHRETAWLQQNCYNRRRC